MKRFVLLLALICGLGDAGPRRHHGLNPTKLSEDGGT